MAKLGTNERWLIESGINHYRLIGPGLVWLKPWQKVWAKLNVGSQEQFVAISQVRTLNNIPVNTRLHILYQIDPQLFTPSLLPKIPNLNSGGWQNILQRDIEHILRQLLTNHLWQNLNQDNVQQRLERQLAKMLADRLKVIGLKVLSVNLIRIDLPEELQQTIIQHETDGFETRGRMQILKEYFDIFGQDLPLVMPHIIQWEMLNIMSQKDNTQYLVTSTGFPDFGQRIGNGVSQPVYQMQLPVLDVNRRWNTSTVSRQNG